MRPNSKLKRILKIFQYRLLHKWRPAHSICAALDQITIEFRSTNKIGEEIFANSFERKERAILSKIIQDGDCVIDVGANVGFFTCLFATSVGSAGKVIALDPTPSVYASLRRNVQRNKLDSTVECHNVALSAKEGRAIMTCFPDGSEVYNSLGAHVPVDHKVLAEGQLEVSVTTLDAILGNIIGEDESKVVFVKIDVEGFEQQVITGGVRTLAQARNCALMVELYEPAAKQCGSTTRETIGLLEKCGYAPFCLVEETMIRKMDESQVGELVEGRLKCPNIFFLKGRFIARAHEARLVL
jgi:FkbM family methyltransferase